MYSKLHFPFGVFVANDEIYIADSDNHRVRKVLTSGNIVTIAGTGLAGYNGDNQPATKASLNNPTSVFVSSQNEVYITEGDGHRIRKILSDGTIETIAGTGKKGYNGDNQLAVEAQVKSPFGLFVTNKGDVLFADYGNHRVRMIRNGIISTIAGTGIGGYDGNLKLATLSQLRHPTSVFVEKEEVYICDCENHRVRKIIRDGHLVNIAGTGFKRYNGDNRPATKANVHNPFSVFVYEGEVYISDKCNHRIRKILTDGTITTIAGVGSFSFDAISNLATMSHLNLPSGIFLHDCELYIADQFQHRICKIERSGMLSNVAGTDNTPGFEGDVPYDFEQFPHIGHHLCKVKKGPLQDLQKYHRDCLPLSEIIVFFPLLNLMVPRFASKLTTLIGGSQEDLEYTQALIDFTIYGKDYIVPNGYENVIRCLGVINDTPNSEFNSIKQALISEFISCVDLGNILSCLNLIDEYPIDKCDNNILSKLKAYCIEFLALEINKDATCHVITDPRLEKYAMLILKESPERLSTIRIADKELKREDCLKSLYNDQSTADVKIIMQDGSVVYCHKTIISSDSVFFNSMFGSDVKFKDLSRDLDTIDVFTPECNTDILEYILKYCYGIEQVIATHLLIPLIEMAHLHEIPHLLSKCNTLLDVTTENFFQVAELLNLTGFTSETMSIVDKKLVDFIIKNKIIGHHNIIQKLPVSIRIHILKEWDKQEEYKITSLQTSCK